MRLRRCLCLVLLCAFICCTLFSVSAFAAEGDRYFYNDVEYPNIMTLPEYDQYEYASIVAYSSTSIWVVFDNGLSANKTWSGSTLVGYSISPSDISSVRYQLVDGVWTNRADSGWNLQRDDDQFVWTSKDILYDNKDVIVSGSEIVVVLAPPPPSPVADFMSSVGQIFTSAVSWVGDVGSTILQQPLLLAFTALPLCGLGIAVFRRLKETV